MRYTLLLLLLIPVSMAQFEELDMQIEGCQRSCCELYDGGWDAGSHECVFQRGAGELEYYECSNSCLESNGNAIGGYGAGNLCCAPGFVVLGLALAVQRAGSP